LLGFSQVKDGVWGGVEEVSGELGAGGAGEGAQERGSELGMAVEGEQTPGREVGDWSCEETEGHCRVQVVN